LRPLARYYLGNSPVVAQAQEALDHVCSKLCKRAVTSALAHLVSNWHSNGSFPWGYRKLPPILTNKTHC